jgi:uncharacterized membrane protein YgaE (UPF0421/DUF939 family)
MKDVWSKIRASLNVDLNLIAPVVGVITALPVVAVFAVGLAIGGTHAAISMAVGANLIAIASLVGASRLPIGVAITDALAMGFAVFIGSVTVPYPWLHDVVLIPWCFGAGMLVAFGATQATVGTQAIIAIIAFGRFASSPLGATRLGLLVVAGALVEVAALLLLRLPPSLRFQRNQVADVFKGLADLAQRDPRLPTADVAVALDTAEQTLASRSLFDRSDARVLRSALNQARRMRLEFTNLAGLRTRLSVGDVPNGQSAIDACLDQAAQALIEISERFRHPRQGTGWQSFVTSFGKALLPLDEAIGDSKTRGNIIARQSVEHLVALGGQMRAAGTLIDESRSNRSRHAWRPEVGLSLGPNFAQIQLNPTLVFTSLHNEWGVFVDNLRLDSHAFRHAVRLAIAVPLSAFVASWLSLPRGYWLPFSVAVILRPDYSTLLSRGLGRVIGTLLGATLAAVLIGELHPDLVVTTVLVGLTAWAAYATWAANFALSIGFITALVLILLSTSLTNPVSTALDRLIDVSLGGAIAVVAYLVWPTSPRIRVSAAQAGLFAAQRDYLAIVFGLVKGNPTDAAQLSAYAVAARQAWGRAVDAVGMSIAEPGTSHLHPDEGQALLACAMRIVRAIHALRIGAERGTTVTAFAEFEALGDAMVTALGTVSKYLSSGSVQTMPNLRQLYRITERPLHDIAAPAALAINLDELVNAINTAAHLVGLDQPVNAPN